MIQVVNLFVFMCLIQAVALSVELVRHSVSLHKCACIFSCVYLAVSGCVAVPSCVHVSSCVVALWGVDVMLSVSARHLSGE